MTIKYQVVLVVVLRDAEIRDAWTKAAWRMCQFARG
jgi:hypothetical protein